MIWAGFALVIVSYIVVFKTPIGLRIRACGEHPRAADTVGINVYAVRYGCRRPLGGARSARRRLPVGRIRRWAFNDNMTDGRGFIALAAMIFGNWRPAGAFGAALLFGLSSASHRLQVYSPSAATLFNVLPVRAHPDCGCRRDRSDRSACGRWQAVQEAVAVAADRSSAARSPAPRSRPISQRPARCRPRGPPSRDTAFRVCLALDDGVGSALNRLAIAGLEQARRCRCDRLHPPGERPRRRTPFRCAHAW